MDGRKPAAVNLHPFAQRIADFRGILHNFVDDQGIFCIGPYRRIRVPCCLAGPIEAQAQVQSVTGKIVHSWKIRIKRTFVKAPVA